MENEKNNKVEGLQSRLVRCLPTEQLVDLINSIDEGDLSRAGYPDYILENNEEGFDAIYDYFQDCYSVIQCMHNSFSRYKIEDKWVIFDRDLTAIYSFSDNETLFEFLPAETIAEMFEQSEIELTITTKRQD